MKVYNLYQIDSFTTEKFGGNPAGVVTNADGLTDSDMQRIAREMNNSETAFIFQSESDEYDVHLRFFTPTTEVPFCGHATIAAHYALAVENNMDTSKIIQKVMVGNLPVEIIRDNNDYKIIITQGDIQFNEPFSERLVLKICKALNVHPGDLLENAPVQIVSTGHSKIMVCLKSFSKLKKIKPNYKELAIISKECDCNGFFVFTKDTDDPSFYINARMFGPAMGINEDPVNGSSGGALGAYLVKHSHINSKNKKQTQFKVKQGFSVGREGMVEVVMELDNHGNPVIGKIIGNAVIVYKTILEV